MNKEEFKLNLMEQLKTNYDNMLLIMLEPNRQKWNGTNRYVKEKRLCCSKFKLDFTLFYAHNENGKGELSIQFEDVTDLNRDWHSYKDVEFLSPYFMPNGIFEEHLTIYPNSISFTLHYYELSVKGFQIERVNKEVTATAGFNLKPSEFSVKMANHIIKLIDSCRDNGGSIYLDAICTNKMADFVLDSDVLSEDTKVRFYYYIKNLNDKASISTTTQILDYLITSLK